MAFLIDDTMQKVMGILGLTGPVRSIDVTIEREAVAVIYIERYAEQAEVEQIVDVIKDRCKIQEVHPEEMAPATYSWDVICRPNGDKSYSTCNAVKAATEAIWQQIEQPPKPDIIIE